MEGESLLIASGSFSLPPFEPLLFSNGRNEEICCFFRSRSERNRRREKLGKTVFRIR